jgi:hypothetical protein
MVPGTVTANPADTLAQLAGGCAIQASLQAIARLGVADALNDVPQSAAALASAVGAEADPLDRALRLLASYGVFEKVDDLWAHTPTSRLLRKDHPQSMVALVLMLGDPVFWTCLGELDYGVRTGRAVADKVLDGGVWGHFRSHPEKARIFDAAMTGKAHGQVAGVLAAYDFSGFDVVADIGGGRGHLVKAIVDTTPNVRGVLFDQAHVVEAASDITSDRLTLQAGDFFSSALPSADVYLLMEVIHDWNDERSTAILKAVRSAARPGARVLLIESIIAETPDPSWPKILDLWMLAIGGKQRTQREYAELLSAAGFTFTREIETFAGVSIIEGTVG